MFKKLLNVGKGHSSADKLQQQQQQQQKNLFQLNEIGSYGFSHLCCLGYSPSLSLLAVGSKFGLLRVLGNSSVGFSYQLESGNSIRQIEFIDCRTTTTATTTSNQHHKRHDKQQKQSAAATDSSAITSPSPSSSSSAKIIVLTDNGQLHLFELKTCKQQNFADNTTQTDGLAAECCQQQQQNKSSASDSTTDCQQQNALEFTKLERVGVLDYFKYKPDEEDRSSRITTLEVSADGQTVFVGTEGGNLYLVPLNKFELIGQQQQKSEGDQAAADGGNQQQAAVADNKTATVSLTPNGNEANAKEEETTDVNLNDEPQIEEVVNEPFEMIKFDEHVAKQLGDDIKSKKQGAIESIKRHPASAGKLLLSYHRGLNVIFEVQAKTVEKYFYHNQVLESSCFADQNGDFFYTSHNDGSYIKWDTRRGNQIKANEDFLGQLYGPYPCKPTPKIQACTGLVNDQLEDLVFFSGGMPRATYDDKNPVTIVHAESDGKDTIKTVLDFTSKVLDFVVITRPRGQLGAGAKSTGEGRSGGGKKNKNKQQQQQQQQRNNPIAVALAILAEEEFVVIDLLNNESYLEFALPYLNCVHSSAITCNQHYSDISDELYDQLLAYNKLQLKDKLSSNEWPIIGGKVIDAPEVKAHDILLTGHEDGSVDFWDVSDLSMRHLLHLSTARFFSTDEEDLVPIEETTTTDNNKQELADNNNQDASANSPNNEENKSNQLDNSSAWPPLKRVGRFDPYTDDTRLAVRKLSLCPQTGTLVVAGTGGQVLVFELKDEQSVLEKLQADEITIVSDQRFAWKGREKLSTRQGSVFKFEPGYQLASYVQLNPPVSATSLDLRSDWHLYAIGTSYGFLMYDYLKKHSIVNKCTLNVQDFSIISGDSLGTGTAMSRKKSFRKSLRESFRRLRLGKSQRAQQQQQQVVLTSTSSVAAAAPGQAAGESAASSNNNVLRSAFGGGRVTTGVRTLTATPSSGAASDGGNNQQQPLVHRNVYSTERQVEQKIELGSIVRCLTLTSAVITNNLSSFKPTLWVGTNSGQVLVYAINLATSEVEPAAAGGNTEQVPAVVVEAAAAAQQSSEQDQGAAISKDQQQQQQQVMTTAKLVKEIQLRHKAPIIAIFTTPDAPPTQATPTSNQAELVSDSAKSSPEKQLPSDFVGGADGKTELESSVDQDGGKKEADEQAERAGTPVVASVQQQQPQEKHGKQRDPALQPRVLVCSEEQFKVFNLPNFKPFCKFKLTAHEGLRAKKISITQFLKPATSISKQQAALSSSKSLQSFATQTSPPSSPVPPADGSDEANSLSAKQTQESNNNSLSALNNNNTKNSSTKELMNAKFGAKTSSNTLQVDSGKLDSANEQQQFDNNLFEPYMVCMSNQGDCAIYSVPDLKRQAQIQVCKREDVNGITSAMLTNYGEGYYLKSSSNFLRFSISTQRVLRVLSVV